VTTAGGSHRPAPQVRGIVLDMSAVNRIDYSGVLALQAVLEQLKPGTRKRVARGGEIVTADGVTSTRRRGDTYVENVRGIRVHMAHVTARAHRVLVTAGLLDGDLLHGKWGITVHATVSTAVEALPDDLAAVESECVRAGAGHPGTRRTPRSVALRRAEPVRGHSPRAPVACRAPIARRFPFEWLVPAGLARFQRTGTVVTCHGEAPMHWQCYESASGKKSWVRTAPRDVSVV
jgi:hypothetical protein